MMTRCKHSFFPGLEQGGTIERRIAISREHFVRDDPQITQHLYQATWREFALAVMEGLDQTRQPVVIETSFSEYVDDDGMTVLHFKAHYTPVRFRDVTMARMPRTEPWQYREVEIQPVIEPMTFMKRLKFLVTGKV